MLDASHLEDLVLILQAMFAYDFDDPGFQPDFLYPDTLEAIRGSVSARQVLQIEYQQIEEDVRVLRNEVLRNAKQNCPLPVNLRRLIWNAQKLFSCKPHKPGPAGSVLGPLCFSKQSSVLVIYTCAYVAT